MGGHALTVDEIPAHRHDDGSLVAGVAGLHTHVYGRVQTVSGNGWQSGQSADVGAEQRQTGSAGSHGHAVSGETGETGGGQEHDHDIDHDGSWRPAYADVIICQRD